ncbi:hypothetical protein Sjap_008511 [Stephania japonica]|uniref:Uncharacterized protein n=1 Tax=Stephania japonica TaxID=461633 RepID=A0AAP0PBF1_9MAGN
MSRGAIISNFISPASRSSRAAHDRLPLVWFEEVDQEELNEQIDDEGEERDVDVKSLSSSLAKSEQIFKGSGDLFFNTSFVENLFEGRMSRGAIISNFISSASARCVRLTMDYLWPGLRRSTRKYGIGSGDYRDVDDFEANFQERNEQIDDEGEESDVDMKSLSSSPAKSE